MDEFAKAIGVALGGMPPVLQAVVLIALAVMGLAYLWRRAGDEAKKEGAAHGEAKAQSQAALAALHNDVKAIHADVQDIARGVDILKDRTPR